MKYFYCTLLITLFTCHLATAQSNFKQGYILDAKNDTIKGYIDYREWNKNPKQISFKPTLDQAAKTYTVNTANGFGITGIEYYDRAVVSVSTSPITLSRLPASVDTSAIIDTVFLRVRVNGSKLTLYELETFEKVIFYIGEKQKATITPLKQYLFLNEENRMIVNSNKYIPQLLNLAAIYQPNDAKLKQLIANANYNIRYLSPIIIRLNGDAWDTQTVVDNTSVRYFVGAGVTNARLKFSGDNAPFSNGKTATSLSPMLSAGIDYLFNKRTEKTVLRLEAALTLSSFNLSEGRVLNSFNQNIVIRSLKFKQTLVSLTPQMLYNFYSTDRFKIYVDVGVNMNFSSFNNQHYQSNYADGSSRTENNLDFESFYITIPIKAGVQMGKNFQIYGGYILPTAITNYTLWSAEIPGIQAGLVYLFQ
ncbi:hypothetical protein ACFQZX_15835 [Mucilaginibacter litoreus]|uniref:Outer membrane protein beta-barrel domain-containing protein n=1 Tax=Mucilaginibacter litoreus TaxID=1048221 RepID=A0ABW3AVM0_9SPHI